MIDRQRSAGTCAMRQPRPKNDMRASDWPSKHVAAVHILATPIDRMPDQHGRLLRHDHVTDERAGVERNQLARQAVIGAHAHGGCVHDHVHARWDGVHGIAFAARKFAAQRLRERLRTLTLQIDDRQRLDTGRRELAADRAAGAARTEQRDSPAFEDLTLVRLPRARIRRRRTCRRSTCRRPRAAAHSTPGCAMPSDQDDPQRRRRAPCRGRSRAIRRDCRMPISAGMAASNRSGSTCIGSITAFMPAAAKSSQ